MSLMATSASKYQVLPLPVFLKSFGIGYTTGTVLGAQGSLSLSVLAPAGVRIPYL